MHGMHSVVDWLCFAVWEDGRLIRSLSLSRTAESSSGEPYEFELPYWAGEHPVEPVPGRSNEGPYPLPFHPLELGEEALRAMFGFIIEGYPDPDDVDADAVHSTPSESPTQAEREAAYTQARAAMGPRRIFKMGADGHMHEVDFNSL